jgi:hypothetical protein
MGEGDVWRGAGRMKKFKVKVEKIVEAEDEDEAVQEFIHWFYDADSNAEILPESDEVDVEEVKQ